MAEDIAFALENDCVPQKEMHAAVARAAKLVDVDHHLGFAPHELSGGQKQRVSLAGVMVDAVKILLFDEPLANLDPAAGKQTIELIDRIQKETDTTVLIIEHRLEDVLWRSVDRIVLMDEGRIAADLRPDELLCSPLLTEAGIREPLYLTALKYAGVTLTPEKKPAHPDTLELTEADKDAVRAWYHAAPAAAPAAEQAGDLTDDAGAEAHDLGDDVGDRPQHGGDRLKQGQQRAQDRHNEVEQRHERRQQRLDDLHQRRQQRHDDVVDDLKRDLQQRGDDRQQRGNDLHQYRQHSAHDLRYHGEDRAQKAGDRRQNCPDDLHQWRE